MAVSRKLKKRKVKNPKCPIQQTFNKNTKLWDDFTGFSTFPEDGQKADDILAKAKKQLTSARKLFAKPNDAVVAQLANIATGMRSIISKLSTNVADPYDLFAGDARDQAGEKSTMINTGFNRQIFKTSVWAEYAEEGKTLLSQIGAIARVKNSNATPKDIGGMLGVIGDMGSALIGFGAEGKNEKAFEDVVKAFGQKLFSELPLTQRTAKINEMSKTVSDARSGAAITGGKKSLERGTCMTEKTKENKNVRKGLMALGEEIDNTIDSVGKKEILPAVYWPWQTVPNRLISCGNKEPWAGHISGSIGELLYILDLLEWNPTLAKATTNPSTGDADPLLSYTAPLPAKSTLQAQSRKIRAALASAFLIGFGYHSAAEVAYTVRAYLGEPWKARPAFDPKKVITIQEANTDAEKLDEWCTEDSTTYITNLINAFIKTR